jgi:hypothetical protein
MIDFRIADQRRPRFPSHRVPVIYGSTSFPVIYGSITRPPGGKSPMIPRVRRYIELSPRTVYGSNTHSQAAFVVA